MKGLSMAALVGKEVWTSDVNY